MSVMKPVVKWIKYGRGGALNFGEDVYADWPSLRVENRLPRQRGTSGLTFLGADSSHDNLERNDSNKSQLNYIEKKRPTQSIPITIFI